MSQRLIESFLSSSVDDLSLALKTDRLVLEPITTDHVEKMLQILCDEALYQYIPQNPPSSESLKKTYGFWQNRKPPDSKEIWLNWAAKLKTTNEYIGHFQAGWDSKNGFSVAYTVGVPFQKQGFAKEAVSSVLDFLVSHFNAETVRAWIDTRNLASINLMKSLGFSQSGFIENADEFKGSKSDEFVFEKTFPSQWERYFQKNKGRTIRPLLDKAISFVTDSTSDKTALDIGSGIGIETLALIDKGYRVTAIDNQIASQKHIENELSADDRLNFKFILSDFSDFHFDQQYDFIWAYHSLPFCNEGSFLRVVQDFIKSVKNGGIFAGSFFGDQDEWSISKRANGLSKKQLDEVFSNFEILEIKETLEKGKLALGGEKKWHIFDIIARKR